MKNRIDTALIMIEATSKLMLMEEKCVLGAIGEQFKATTLYPSEAMVVERDFYAINKELKNLKDSLTKLKAIQ